jgi:hypothetical protein
MFDDANSSPDGMPGLFAPYFSPEPVIDTEPGDYVNPGARLTNVTTYNWIHPLGDVGTRLIAAGMRLDWLHEHRCRPLAHVSRARRRRPRSLSVARQTVAAARVFACCHAPRGCGTRPASLRAGRKRDSTPEMVGPIGFKAL